MSDPIGKPKPKILKQSDPLLRHKFTLSSLYVCARCGKYASTISEGNLDCISDARAAGNAAIGRIVQGQHG